MYLGGCLCREQDQFTMNTLLPQLASILSVASVQIYSLHFYQKFYQAIAVHDASSRHPQLIMFKTQFTTHSRHVRWQHRRLLPGDSAQSAPKT